jgi:hypothetical protein
MKRLALALGIAITLSLTVFSPVTAATVSPGKKCSANQQTALVNGKMFTCRQGKWDNGTTATPVRIAYSKCKLWRGNSSLGFTVATVADGGKTLAMDSVGKFDILDKGLTYEQMACALSSLKAPSYILSQIDNTRAIDGMQQASWGSYKAFWNYHPDDGASLTVSSA